MASVLRFLVDTSILVAHIRQQPPTVLERARRVYGEPVASDISVMELEIGARRAGRQMEFATSFAGMEALTAMRAILINAAAIHAVLLQQNRAIGLLDTIIAATALYHHVPILTLNQKHFGRIPGLTLLPLP